MNKFLLNRDNIIISLSTAAILTISIAFIFYSGSKYSANIVSKTRHAPEEITVYEDVSSTGISEKIRFITNIFGLSAVIIEQDGKQLFQWNMPGKFVPGEFYCFDDTNDDQVKELYVFTYDKDSIFLNGYDIATRSEILKLHVTTFDYYTDRIDFSCYDPKIIDLDNDKEKELLVHFYCAFSKTTRKLFRINIKNKTVLSSPLAGMSICNNQCEYDIDNDGKMEIFGDFPILGNCKPDYPFSDSKGWLMLYDDSLHYKFSPKIINTASGIICTRPIKTGQTNSIFVLSNNLSGTDSSFIGIYNFNGELIRYKFLEFKKNMEIMKLKILSENKILIKYASGVVEVYDSLLKIEKEFLSFPINESGSSLSDVDQDGLLEEICMNKNQDGFIISREDFSNPTEVSIDPHFSHNVYFSVNKTLEQGALLTISFDEWLYMISYSKNPFYQLRFLLLGICFIGFYFLISLIGWIFQFFLKKKYEAENQIRLYQVKAIEQQLNPHFTLNILNGIGSLYEKQEPGEARYYFGKYSKLLRTILFSSGQISTSLKQELEFTHNFLELEQFRLNKAFRFNIDIPDTASAITVPRLLVHTFVENAIKHGIYPLIGEKICTLTISYEQKNQKLLISIHDDGIGRKNASKIKDKTTGKGLKILKSTLKLYEKIEGKKIEFKMSEFSVDPQYPGTLVVITIPI